MKYILFLSLFFSVLKFFGQEEKVKKNAGYVEIGGNAFTFMSLNYERTLSLEKKEIFQLAFRLGGSFTKTDFDSTITYSLPTEINLLIGKNRLSKSSNYLELGVGYTPFFSSSDLIATNIPSHLKHSFYYLMSFRVGYRFVMENSVLFRFGVLGTVFPKTNEGSKILFQPTIGLSFGYIF